MLMAASAVSQDRLDFTHSDAVVAGLIAELPDFTAKDARNCQKAEDALVQTCQFYEDCKNGLEDVFDAKVGETYIEDRFIIFDVMAGIAEKTDDVPQNNQGFLRELGLASDTQEDQSDNVDLDFSPVLMKQDRSEFDRVMTHHKVCLSSVHKAAERLGQGQVETLKVETINGD